MNQESPPSAEGKVGSVNSDYSKKPNAYGTLKCRLNSTINVSVQDVKTYPKTWGK
ncbi:hypothetical protein [Brasilonema sp. UFV-L1]|uniref:hypothetical protein n=1 Tax=Brasilonema sp. UFV-L1 TaxID=2234130 RepID=UPI00145D98E4|nr:hypothetical protein [Brasilonema sp. UFV-L1]